MPHFIIQHPAEEPDPGPGLEAAASQPRANATHDSRRRAPTDSAANIVVAASAGISAYAADIAGKRLGKACTQKSAPEAAARYLRTKTACKGMGNRFR